MCVLYSEYILNWLFHFLESIGPLVYPSLSSVISTLPWLPGIELISTMKVIHFTSHILVLQHPHSVVHTRLGKYSAQGVEEQEKWSFEKEYFVVSIYGGSLAGNCSVSSCLCYLLSASDVWRCRAKSRTRYRSCLLYTSPSPRDATLSRMPSSA